MAKGRPIVGALWLVSPLVGCASSWISRMTAIMVDMAVVMMLNDVVDIIVDFCRIVVELPRCVGVYL